MKDMDETGEAGPPREMVLHFAGRIRELRARKGLTQDQVAKRLSCHESAVSRWENGSRFPTGVDLVALADLLEVSVDDLLGRSRQHVLAGAALVDLKLLERLASAETVEEFELLLDQNSGQAVWLPVPEGAVLMPVVEAMRLTRQVADKFGASGYVDKLFRPRA